MLERLKLAPRNYIILISLALAILILSVYWPVQKYDFINYDDPVYVTDNYLIQRGVSCETVKSIFGHFHTGHWHPLTMISHMLDWQLFGARAGGHHWTNVIIHILNTILLFLLMNKLTGAMWKSALVAALFAVHPLNVESVAWISERKNVLSTFFLILTLYAYTWYADSPGWKRYSLVLIFFVFGLMSKPTLVPLPFALLLFDYWPINRLQIDFRKYDRLKVREFASSRRADLLPLIIEKIPLLALSIISSCFTVFASRYVNDISTFEEMPLMKRISNAGISYVLYIKKLFWPGDLTAIYPITDSSAWQFYLALLFLAGISLLAFRYFWKRPFLFVGWFWYLGMLVPVIGLIQVGSQAMADRYAYVPLIGLLIIIVWTLSDIAADKFTKYAFSTLSVLSLLIFSVISHAQIPYWKDAGLLFQHALEVTVNNPIAHMGLANELLKQNKIDEAIGHYRESLRIDPQNDAALIGLGWALHRRGENREAIKTLKLAEQMNPRSVDVHNRLGIVLAHEGRLDEAMIEYRRAIAMNPDNPLYHNNLGNVLVKKGNIDEAMSEYKEMLRVAPDNADAHYNLGVLLMRQNKNSEAVEHLREALRLSPQYADAHFNLAIVLKQEGFIKEAEDHYREAIKLNPGFRNPR